MSPPSMRPATTDALYRYSKRKWLDNSLSTGEFRLVSASYIKGIEKDAERHDDEQRRNYEIDSRHLTLTHMDSGQEMPLLSNLTISSELVSDYYMLCFTTQNHEMMYDFFGGSDGCLHIRDRNEFSARLYRAVDKILPTWGAANASVIYGGLTHELGPAFMKPAKYTFQFEWRFVWLPMRSMQRLENIVVSIGGIEDIAHVETRA